MALSCDDILNGCCSQVTLPLITARRHSLRHFLLETARPGRINSSRCHSLGFKNFSNVILTKPLDIIRLQPRKGSVLVRRIHYTARRVHRNHVLFAQQRRTLPKLTNMILVHERLRGKASFFRLLSQGRDEESWDDGSGAINRTGFRRRICGIALTEPLKPNPQVEIAPKLCPNLQHPRPWTLDLGP